VEIATGAKKESVAFLEDLLFTHRGISGPGVLQISSYWQPGTPIRLNLAPGTDLLSNCNTPRPAHANALPTSWRSAGARTPGRHLGGTGRPTRGHDWAAPHQ
jgi:predicted flavoprotein YhiN